ncbi:MAG: prepilin-type N-terminal cleavage/methylation domain-containing protein [Sulfuritalea sp.]|nr:prepilin-type N-terminal cleavage/methylation domain-containing protein [Sulfuritalea sp.]
MRNTIRTHQAGFTLVEIAIVLVIIGLLLVGVLQGQEMIENTKTKSVVNDMKAVQVAFNGYIDRYKAMPGDEAAATMNARGWGGTVGGAANGVLAIAPATAFTTGAAEGNGFWRALRGSGLLSGDVTATYLNGLPRHSANGLIAVAVGTTATPVFGLTGTFVCASGLSTKQAAAIDTIIDGPLPTTNVGANVGNLRGGSGATNPWPPSNAASTNAYNETTETNPWTVCMKIG